MILFEAGVKLTTNAVGELLHFFTKEKVDQMTTAPALGVVERVKAKQLGEGTLNSSQLVGKRRQCEAR